MTNTVNENGEEVTVGIIPVESNENSPFILTKPSKDYSINASSTHKIKIGESTFKAYWYTAAINMSYYIDIKRTSTSTKITNAYDLYLLGLGYSISQTYWGYTSSKASYEGFATLYGGFAGLNIYLTSTVSGDTLTIKAKA